jgi:hypothetical protein
MNPSGSDSYSAGFARMREAFERAWQRGAAATHESVHQFCGEPVRIRVVGAALADRVGAAVAHLRSTAAAPPRLTIDLWDAAKSGEAGPPAPANEPSGRVWTLADGLFAASADARVVCHQLFGSVVWLDRRAEKIVGWFPSAATLSLHERAKPLQTLLALWASDRGLQAVHAALVARDGRGILVPGHSGSGKSTVAVACLTAGWTYVGDDWVCVGRAANDAYVGHGLYCSAFLDPLHAMRFPHLLRHAIAPTHAFERKWLLMLSRVVGADLGGSATVRAIVLPRVVDGAGGRHRRASKSEALLMLAPSTVFAMRPRASRAGVERLFEFVQQLPAYWLEIGSDLDAIPDAIDRILADVSAA